VVLEIVGGIVIGPSVLGWVQVGMPIQIVSILRLAALLFMAGLEIEFRRRKGPPLQPRSGAVFRCSATNPVL
jgi:Kef-type K+ transport system membrane component KefB